MNTPAKTTLALITCFALTSGVGRAAQDTWSGATSNDWSTGSNWSAGLAPTSADIARFGYSAQSTPTLGAGPFTVQKMYWYFSGTKTSYNITGAGSANTTLKIDPNTTASANFIENVAVTGASNQTFSDLTLLLEDSNLTGQTKIVPGDGGSVTISSNATLQIGSTTAQTVILEANGPQTGSGALNINGVLKAGVTGSLLSVEKSGVLNLNLAAGSDFTNLQLSSTNGGVINFLAGGALGGSVVIYAGGVANVAASGITLNTTEWSIASGGKIGATYSSGTSTLEGMVTISNAAGATNTFDVASGGTLVLTNRVQLGSATAIVEKTGAGTLNLTYSGGLGNSFTASAFNVTVGTLLVNNTGTTSATGTAPVNVASGATLGGAGRITGVTTISGILAPGNSIGTLTVVNDVTWNGGASPTAATDWKFEIGASNTADLLNILDGGTTSEFLKGTGSAFRFDFQGGTALGTFKLVDWASTASLGGGALGTNFALSDFSYTGLGNSHIGTFQFSGTQLEFVTTVPEPATWALLAFSLTTVVVLRRRRLQ
jgi:fibronectin-binding autotransporter adhesin